LQVLDLLDVVTIGLWVLRKPPGLPAVQGLLFGPDVVLAGLFLAAESTVERTEVEKSLHFLSSGGFTGQLSAGRAAPDDSAGKATP
jgi:hypothetical protein